MIGRLGHADKVRTGARARNDDDETCGATTRVILIVFCSIDVCFSVYEARTAEDRRR